MQLTLLIYVIMSQSVDWIGSMKDKKITRSFLISRMSALFNMSVVKQSSTRIAYCCFSDWISLSYFDFLSTCCSKLKRLRWKICNGLSHAEVRHAIKLKRIIATRNAQKLMTKILFFHFTAFIV